VTLLAAVLVPPPGYSRAAAQAPTGTLHVKVTISGADQNARPVPRHALLISANPTSAAPRRAVTALDGTAQITLEAGNYTVESDQAFVFEGQAYEWSQTLDVAAGRTTSLELTAANAHIETAAAAAASVAGAANVEGSPSGLLFEWQNSVVSIWSATMLGAGFLIDARGLIVTNQRLVGTAASLEIQLSPAQKVTARVLAADADRNVAVLWIDPKAAAAARPVKLGYSDGPVAPPEPQRVFAINAPMLDDKHVTSGAVSRVTAHTILSDIRVDDESLGAPLFDAAGAVVGITAPEDQTSGGGAGATRAVRIDDARTVIAAAQEKMGHVEAPSATLLPVEPAREFPDTALKEAAERRKGNLAPYRVPAADFDVGLITPVLVYSARHQGERAPGRDRGDAVRDQYAIQAARRALEDFANWWDYVRSDRPLLMIRAAPKQVEGFWKSVLRGAAQTQGLSLPAIKHVKAGFARMRLFCGDAEVTPIHPFKIEQRFGETEAVYEGFYVFDPGAIGPHCGSVRLTLFSDKAPDRGDTRVVDAKIVEQVWQDFAPYRASGG